VQTAAPVAAQTASPAPAQKTATQAPAAAAQEQKAEATATPAAPAQAPAQAQTATLETALQYVGCDVAQLYAAVGQPSSAEYASSCMGDGEDGMLTYDTFTVTTYREGGVETVQDAY
jgi:nucleoid-associated protein YgaU